MKDINLPKAGDRAGSVCGPCQNPKDNAGIVLAVYGDRWYDRIALVLMDDGSFEHIVGEYTKAGIGWHCVKEGVPA